MLRQTDRRDRFFSKRMKNGVKKKNSCISVLFWSLLTTHVNIVSAPCASAIATIAEFKKPWMELLFRIGVAAGFSLAVISHPHSKCVKKCKS